MKREADPDVAQAIEIASLCQTLNCLPRAGGLYDQDPKDVYIIREVIMAQAEKQEMDNKRKK